MSHWSLALPTRATRSTILLATAVAAGALAGTVQAQTAAPAGTPRYMSWAGRPATTTPASVIAAEARAEAQAQADAEAEIAAEPTQVPTRRAMIPRRVAPTVAAARPALQPTPTPQRVSRGPTPASAWLDPQPVSAFAPGAPDPIAYTRETPALIAAADTTAEPAWAPAPAPQSAPQAARAVSDDRPNLTVAAAPPAPQPAPTTATADPMAPRRDALIFQLRPQAALQQAAAAASDQPAPQVLAEAAPPVAVPTAARPGQQTSRYYSVHREAGHAPDRTPLPEAVFYDSVALDLAEPPETEPPLRDAQGRLRPPVRDEDPERP